MSHTLKQFYQDLRCWLDAGKPRHPVFDGSDGLCWLLTRWGNHHRLGFPLFNAIKQEQGKLLHAVHIENRKAGTSASMDLPFNSGLSEYYRECDNDTIFDNPRRLAYIREHSV